MKRYVTVGPTVLVVLWGIVSYCGLVNPLLLPTPDRVLKKLAYLIVTGSVAADVELTVVRWMAGLGLGIAAGVPLGLLMGISRRIYSALEIVVDFFRSIPVMAMFPLFVTMFGIGDRSKIAISAWTTALYVLINTMYGVQHSSGARRIVAQVLRATKWQMFFGVILPEAFPNIVVGVRLSLSMSLVLVVASEMVMGTSAGLGKRIFESAMTYSLSEMYATIVIAGALGYLSNRLFVAVEHRVIHWTAE
jgi:ABC-type nitrate/sulfonate/bicarbonate transport system permease component